MNGPRRGWERGRRAGAAARRGVVLPFVLVALGVATACVAAVAAAAREAGRGARGAAAGLQAATAADAALAELLVRWPARWNGALAPGAAAVRAVTTPAGAAEVRVARLDGARLALETSAQSVSAPAGVDGRAVRRRLLLVRLRHVTLSAAAAVTAGGPVRVAAGAVVAAADGVPPGWTDCEAAAGAFAAVAAPAVDAEPGAVVDGAVDAGPAAWAAAMAPQFGDDGYAAHAGRAHVVLDGAGPWGPVPAPGAAVPPGDLGGEPCAVAAASWGEPDRGGGAVAACAGAFPVVHLRGGVVRLRAPARFQGTLLVDGDLVIEGVVRGAGLVVVRGAVDASGGALVLDGALVAGGGVRLGGGSRVRASSCAAARAGRYAARPEPLARRAWGEVVR